MHERLKSFLIQAQLLTIWTDETRNCHLKKDTDDVKLRQSKKNASLQAELRLSVLLFVFASKLPLKLI